MNIELGILNDSLKQLFDLLIERHTLKLEHRKELLELGTIALNSTEEYFYNSGSRNIQRNTEIAEAWRKLGVAVRTYLPNETFGYWLLNKSTAWQNPGSISEYELEMNGMKLNEIRNKLDILNKKLFHK